LERIRDIRASGKRFYQKVRDLFALSNDYDKTDKAAQMFFAETQNKLQQADKQDIQELRELENNVKINKSNKKTKWRHS
jgi:hypothetical protein